MAFRAGARPVQRIYTFKQNPVSWKGVEKDRILDSPACPLIESTTVGVRLLKTRELSSYPVANELSSRFYLYLFLY